MNLHWFTVSTKMMYIGIVEKRLANLFDKKKYVVHIKNLKWLLNSGLELKALHRFIKLNQKAWLKPYIDMNTEIRQKSEKRF